MSRLSPAYAGSVEHPQRIRYAVGKVASSVSVSGRSIGCPLAAGGDLFDEDTFAFAAQIAAWERVV